MYKAMTVIIKVIVTNVMVSIGLFIIICLSLII